MTLVSSIIQRAYRETNIIPLGAVPNTEQINEALDSLNVLLLSTVGNEGGEPGFKEINVGGDFDQSYLLVDYVPDNSRLVLNLTDPAVVGLNPTPYEGQRIAIVDILGNLSTIPLIISGNGRNIEGAESVTLDTNYMSRQWMYRADTGNWVRISLLVAADNMPLPEEYDDYFIIMLAARLSPRYGQTMSPESVAALKRTRSQIRNRYQNRKYFPDPDPGLLSEDERMRYYRDPDDPFALGLL
jgi:hypothetical protein